MAIKGSPRCFFDFAQYEGFICFLQLPVILIFFRIPDRFAKGRIFRCVLFLNRHMHRGPFGKYQAFQQRIAGQPVGPVDAIAAGFSGGVQPVHGGAGIPVHPDAAHEIMLGGHNGNPLAQRIVSFLLTAFQNMREMLSEGFFPDGTHIQPDAGGLILFHLFINLLGQQIPGKQFVDKSFSRLIVQESTFSTHRLGNQELTLFASAGIEGGRVNLDIVRILKPHPVL